MTLEYYLKRLVTLKTITGDQKELARSYRWIKSELKGLPVFFKKESRNGYDSLLITTKKTKTPMLWLAAHIDVVAGSLEIFKPKVKNGTLIGRGVFDMKYAIACYLKLFKDTGKTELSQRDIGIMITADEEKGGFNGTKWLLDTGYKSKVAFLPDGGNEWSRELGSKGIWQISVKSQGVNGHSSRPWVGRNAISSLAQFLIEVEKLFEREPCGDSKHWHNTMTPSIIQGGKAINQIPDTAEVQVDIRYINPESRKDLEKRIKKLARRFPGISIVTKTLELGYELSAKERYGNIFYALAKREFNIGMKTGKSHGSSDARFFARKKIPVIVTRPKGGGHHSENEWIDLKDLGRLYEVLKEFVIDIHREKNSIKR